MFTVRVSIDVTIHPMLIEIHVVATSTQSDTQTYTHVLAYDYQDYMQIHTVPPSFPVKKP